MRKIALTIGVVCFLMGCSTKIASNKATDFSEKITKLFIIVKGTETSQSFLDKLTENFGAHLAENGIPYQKFQMEALSLESEEDIQKKVVEFGPNLVMMISQTESRRTTNGGFSPGFNGPGFGFGGGTSAVTGATFDIKLYRPGSQNPVWRGNLKADAQFGLASSAKKANEKMIKNLENQDKCLIFVDK